jgi:hypothetical protein
MKKECVKPVDARSRGGRLIPNVECPQPIDRFGRDRGFVALINLRAEFTVDRAEERLYLGWVALGLKHDAAVRLIPDKARNRETRRKPGGGEAEPHPLNVPNKTNASTL